MEEVENYLKNEKYPEGLSKGEKANFQRKVRNNFKLEDGILFYKHAQEIADDATVWKICVRSETEKDRIIDTLDYAHGSKVSMIGSSNHVMKGLEVSM